MCVCVCVCVCVGEGEGAQYKDVFSLRLVLFQDGSRGKKWEGGCPLLVRSVEALRNHCLKGLGKASPEL